MSLTENLGKNVAHVLLGLIFSIAMIALTTIEFYFGRPIDDAGLLFIVFQNIGLGIANSYYVSKVKLTASGLSEATQNQ